MVAAYEFLVVTPAIANLIRENKTFRIDSAIQTGKKYGMQLLDEHLWSLYERGLIEAADMQAPVRDAMCSIERTIDADGRRLRFGGDSVILGYAGENILLEEYVDPIAAAHPCKLNEIRGIFYLCSRSAVVLHMPLIDAGFHSILFTRGNLPPEAYTINGIM